MGSSTFGYDKGEDRVWLSFNDNTPRLWFTRRLVSHLLGPMLHAFELAAPGSQGGADAGTRAWANAALTVAGRVSAGKATGCARADSAQPASSAHTQSRQGDGDNLTMGRIIRAPPG